MSIFYSHMKKILIWSLVLTTVQVFAQNDYPFQAVNFTNVKLTDNFWLPRIRTNHTVTIPASFERCQNTGRVKNFEMAAAKSVKFCTTYPFDDTDIYKTIEGASFSLSLFPDKKLELYVDSLITKIEKAQEPDGYLYTARTIDPLHPHSWAGKQRWEKERELSHELYNSGHLYEAAAAHYYATGKKNLLNIATKNADLVCSVFGNDKLHVAPGHQIIEMGLVKLYRITKKPEYLQTAKFFIEERGRYKGYDTANKDPWKNGAYWQDHKPVIQQKEGVGHAVRAGYLYAGVADVVALTGDRQLLQAIDNIWENVVSKKIYLQGGIGSVGSGERFGNNYELPNSTAYNETCAAIANVYWNHRMFLLHGESKYIDVLEKSLYNGLISGVGLDGKSFFYSNAMQVKNSSAPHGLEYTRSGWFECSCCPTNLTRLLPSIPGYMYAQKENDVYVNLYAASTTNLSINNKKVVIEQQNNFPWDGNLKFIVSPSSSHQFNLLVRIPGWAQNVAIPSDLYRFASNDNESVVIKVNGQQVKYEMVKGYALIARKWSKGDVVEVLLPMQVRKVIAHDSVTESRGKVALQRGPIIYCAEWADNYGKAANIIVPGNATFSSEYNPGLLNGVTVLKSELPVVSIDPGGENIKTVKAHIIAIPYYAWANRGKGEMIIWFPQKIKEVDLISAVASDYSNTK